MMLQSIYVVTDSRLNQYDGQVTVTLFKDDELITQYWENGILKERPCEDGDVLSVQPDGSLYGRPSGTHGPYELATICSKGLLYKPIGSAGKSYIIPYAE